MLTIHGLSSGYGETKILFDIDLKVEQGTVLALSGRNGVGKTTLLKSITNLLPKHAGTIVFDGKDISQTPPHLIARQGLALVPETRDIFASLTVLENLKLAAAMPPSSPPVWDLESVFDLMPNLKNRTENMGNELSGGEQQILAIMRALLTGPKLLLLDEPTEGLAPVVVKTIRETLEQLKQRGLTIILVEQNFRFAASLADKVAVIAKGQIAYYNTAPKALKNHEMQQQLLGI